MKMKEAPDLDPEHLPDDVCTASPADPGVEGREDWRYAVIHFLYRHEHSRHLQAKSADCSCCLNCCR